jgi:hypothetical protein
MDGCPLTATMNLSTNARGIGRQCINAIWMYALWCQVTQWPGNNESCTKPETAVTPYARSLMVKEQVSELSHYILLMSGDLLPWWPIWRLGAKQLMTYFSQQNLPRCQCVGRTGNIGLGISRNIYIEGSGQVGRWNVRIVACAWIVWHFRGQITTHPIWPIDVLWHRNFIHVFFYWFFLLSSEYLCIWL